MGSPCMGRRRLRPYSGGWSSARGRLPCPDNGQVTDEQPPYPAALRLAGRRAVVVGGGHVAQRRVPALLAAGADVVVVSPVITPAIEGLTGELTWERRPFVAADLDDAWYCLAATDDV